LASKDTKPFRYLEGQTQLTDVSGYKRARLLSFRRSAKANFPIEDKRGDIKVHFNIDTEDFHLENSAIKSDPKWISYLTPGSMTPPR
jgi:predicted metalloprotease with PDZ domain